MCTWGACLTEDNKKILDAKVPGVNVPYEWDAGECASKFFIKIRDEEEIWGTKCPKCDKTYLPPREVCPDCFEEDLNWVKIEGEGELVTFTKVNYEEPLIQPKEPPIYYGVVKLDGADTGLTHFLGEVEPEDLESGMRMKAVFKEKSEREGSFLDIKYFKPAE